MYLFAIFLGSRAPATLSSSLTSASATVAYSFKICFSLRSCSRVETADLACYGQSLYALSRYPCLTPCVVRLAATLGAKSSFRKLPRRSVLTADISQLCDLISRPSEPLALRLSSNLMIGVARYVLFQINVTTHHNSLLSVVFTKV